MPPKLEEVSAKLGYSKLSSTVLVEVSANLASVVMARMASLRDGVISGGLRIGASCVIGLAEIGEGIGRHGLSRCLIFEASGDGVDGEVGAKEMKDGPESVDRLVPRDLGDVYY